MRHAGLLRIDHAMGLTRLFVIPDGAKPAEGAYVAYPVDELIGQIALESQRHKCMIVGEDLGTVPEGFREKLDQGRHLRHARAVVRARGMRFPRSRSSIPALRSPAPATHDLPTLAGWWQGADIAERLASACIGLEDAARALAERARRKARARSRRCVRAGADRRGPRLSTRR